MVNHDKIRHKMMIIENNLIKLNSLERLPRQEFLSDFRNVESAKHLLQVSIEAMGDVCDHIIAKNRLGTPESLADGFLIMANHNYLNRNNTERYITMTKFRNKIVHLYQEIKDEEIYKILQNNLEDFRLFITEILKLI
jgi:uncharacterized protein YutE (UPF0331/DUF86 family)